VDTGIAQARSLSGWYEMGLVRISKRRWPRDCTSRDAMFLPIQQSLSKGTWLLMRSNRDAQQLTTAIRNNLRDLDAGLPFSVQTWNRGLDWFCSLRVWRQYLWAFWAHCWRSRASLAWRRIRSARACASWEFPLHSEQGSFAGSGGARIQIAGVWVGGGIAARNSGKRCARLPSCIRQLAATQWYWLVLS